MSTPDPETPENPYLFSPGQQGQPGQSAQPAYPPYPGQPGPAGAPLPPPGAFGAQPAPGAPYGPYPTGAPHAGPVAPYGMPGRPHPQPYGTPVSHHPHHPQPFGAYGAPGGTPVPWGPPPDHPNATTAMCLGIAGVVAFPPLAPVAWVMGGRARREIDASGGQLGGRSQATTGYVTGIVGSVMLGLFVAWMGLVIALAVGLASG